MSVVFKDSLFDSQWLRTAAYCSSGGAELGECLAAARQIRECDADGWFAAWDGVGQRVLAEAAASRAAGRMVSALSTGWTRSARPERPAPWRARVERATLGSIEMLRPETSLGLARRRDAVEIAVMSRDLIENGLGWSWTPERVAASVRSPTAIVVVARAAGRVEGFGIMRYGDDDAHLDLLGVAVDCRRQGLGRRLVEWLEEVALVAGISAVFLEVRGSNYDAQTFYERLGYRKLAQIARYYQGRESAIRMGRELGSRSQSASDVSTGLPEWLQPTRSRSRRGGNAPGARKGGPIWE